MRKEIEIKAGGPAGMKRNDAIRGESRLALGISLIPKTVVMILVCLLISCSSASIENQLVRSIKQDCVQSDCIIRLKDVAAFDWDEMYVFDYSVSIDQIEKITGVKTVEHGQFTRKIMFTKNGNLVYYEELPTSVKHAMTDQVYFNYSTSSHYHKYTVENAVFRAERILVDGYTCYELNQIERID
jgi:hypothetical protein